MFRDEIETLEYYFSWPSKKIKEALTRIPGITSDLGWVGWMRWMVIKGHRSAYRNTRVKSEKIVTKFGESLNLVMFLVNILVKN